MPPANRSIDYASLGLVRIGTVAPPVHIANPEANAEKIRASYERLVKRSCSVVLTPELSLTGYTCEDLFLKDELLDQTRSALLALASITTDPYLVVGAPCQLVDGRMLNCAFVLADGKILGAVPKLANPNHGEFYEQRWFSSGRNVVSQVRIGDHDVPVDCRQLFRVGTSYFAIEICEDLWAVEPVSGEHALNGATILLNPSASPELVSKVEYRRDLVRMQSARCIAAYVYAGSGPTESTKDLVFGGHLLAAENGILLGESSRYELSEQAMVVDVDVQKLGHERRCNSTFTDSPRKAVYQTRGQIPNVALENHLRVIDSHPFVPKDVDESDARAQEILNIQATGLARRMDQAASKSLVIGLSGGLDSTLAFLVCLEALQRLNKPRTAIFALTMPGPGTSKHTLESVRLLCEYSEVPLTEISIEAALAQHLQDLDHEESSDIVFENSQARERTQILFDMANKVDGIVVGTGDLSELALGWCTYNADHMASYNVNVGVPKTLISYLVQWYASHKAPDALSEVLTRVLDTPISPELIPHERGEMTQFTEDLIGPYELHDFFLYQFLRTGAGVQKIFVWANEAFSDRYAPEELKQWLKRFFTRFLSQQFKRSTLPAGPKVGTVSLSPRGDWRMPDEVDMKKILQTIDEL